MYYSFNSGAVEKKTINMGVFEKCKYTCPTVLHPDGT